MCVMGVGFGVFCSFCVGWGSGMWIVWFLNVIDGFWVWYGGVGGLVVGELIYGWVGVVWEVCGRRVCC